MGYLPRDLLMSQGFVRRAGEKLARAWRRNCAARPPLLVGVATLNPADMGRPLFNSAVLLQDGARGAGVPQDAAAHLRRVRRGPLLRAGRANRRSWSWAAGAWASASAKTSGTTAISGSAGATTRTRSKCWRRPARRPSSTSRHRRSPWASSSCARRCWATWRGNTVCRVAIVNQVGGNDDLIFDGHSGAFDAQGRMFARARGFARTSSWSTLAPRHAEPSPRKISSRKPRSGPRWCWACAITLARRGFARCCWACPAASTRRSRPRSRPMRWAPRTCWAC